MNLTGHKAACFACKQLIKEHEAPNGDIFWFHDGPQTPMAHPPETPIAPLGSAASAVPRHPLDDEIEDERFRQDRMLEEDLYRWEAE